MSKYIDVKRLEFIITHSCSGNCRHCSNDWPDDNETIDTKAAVDAVNRLAKFYKIESIMTFGGEPLLYPGVVCAIHEAAGKNNIESRDIITNGYFSDNRETIDATVQTLCESGVTKILLSVDAFHQENIPMKPVLCFAESLLRHGFRGLMTNPAWLAGIDHDNAYNRKTRDIINTFREIGIDPSGGNIVFPAGRAVKNLAEYFPKPDKNELFVPCGTMPYTGKIDDIGGISIDPNGDVIICSMSIGNIHKKDIIEIIEQYDPYSNMYTAMLVEGGVKKLYNYLLEHGIVVNTEDCFSSCMVCNKIFKTAGIKL